MTNSIELANKRGIKKLEDEIRYFEIESSADRERAATIGLILRQFVKYRAEKHDDKIKDLNELKKKWIAKRKEEVGKAEELIDVVDEMLRKEYIARVKEHDLQQAQVRQMESGGEGFLPDYVAPALNNTIETELGTVNVRPEPKIEVKDKMALIKAIAACEWPLTYVEIDTAFIKKDVKERNWHDIPGIEILPSAVVTGRVK